MSECASAFFEGIFGPREDGGPPGGGTFVKGYRPRMRHFSGAFSNRADLKLNSYKLKTSSSLLRFRKIVLQKEMECIT